MGQSASAQAGAAGKWYAVVIGIDHYVDVRVNQLKGAVNDARAIATLLQAQLSGPELDLRLLVAPAPAPVSASATGSPSVPADALAAGAAAIRTAFAEVGTAAGAGDHVVLYYAGHGVRVAERVAEQQGEDGALWVFGIAPSDFQMETFGPMIQSPEVVGFLDGLAKKGVQTTAFFDCCHSGGAIRDPGGEQQVRGFLVTVPAGWIASHASGDTTAAPGNAVGSGWAQATSAGGVVMAACCAEQVAGEGWGDDNKHHGFFTTALLRALNGVSPVQAGDLRWMDLLAKVRAAMPSRLSGDQRPTVEGTPESLVFGGHFQPFDPGFFVTNDPTATPPCLCIDGGSMQGLDVGAVVRIYPPHTADFEAAEKAAKASGAVPVEVTIGWAGPAKSTARSDHEIDDKSRARLIQHPPGTPPVDVRLIGLPDEVAEAVVSVLDAREVRVVQADAGCDVEVVPWKDAIPAWDAFTQDHPKPEWVDASGGWAVVPFSSTRTQVTPDDVIAYLPPVCASRDADTTGRALARGLGVWARYLDVVRRTHSDPVLAQYLEVSLCKGPPDAAPDATYERLSRNAAGDYEVTESDNLWVELRAKTGLPDGIFAGVLACSGDGNIELAWPDSDDVRLGLAGSAGQAKEGLVEPQIKYVGPLGASVRPDQKRSAYTIKVVAYAGTGAREPVDMKSLARPVTVQDAIAQALAAGTRDVGPKPPLPGPVWAMWDLPIRSRAMSEALPSATSGAVPTTGGAPAAKARLVVSSAHSEGLRSVTLSEDGRFALTCSFDGTVALWDVRSWSPLWRGESREVQWKGASFSPLFSPARAHVLLCGEPIASSGDAPVVAVVYIWDVCADVSVCLMAPGEGVVSAGPDDCPPEAMFSPDGRQVLGLDVCGDTGDILLWSAETGAQEHRLKNPGSYVLSPLAVFSREGDALVTASEDGTLQAWSAATGEPLGAPIHVGGSIKAISLAHDRTALIASEEISRGTVKAALVQYRIDDGKLVGRWDVEDRFFAIHVAADGRTVILKHARDVSVWDMDRGEVVSRSSQADSDLWCTALHPDGRVVCASSGNGHVLEWHPASGPLLTSPPRYTRDADRAMFDGRSIRVVYPESTALWDGVTGSPREVDVKPPAPPAPAAPRMSYTVWANAEIVSPDGGVKLVQRGPFWDALLMRVQTNERICQLDIPTPGHVVDGSFSADGHDLLLLFAEGLLQRWGLPPDALAADKSPTSSYTINIHATSVAFSPDARWFVTASRDGVTRVWGVETGALVCSLVSFLDGTWAVIDPEGRYDASNGGDGIEGLSWVVGLERVALSQLKERYYDPGLLGKKLGWRSEPLRPVSGFSAPKLYPQVAPRADWQKQKLLVTLTDQGGGFGPVRVAINNKLAFEIELRVTGDAVQVSIDGKPVTDAESARAMLTRGPPVRVHLGVSFKDSRLLLPDNNQIVVTALNEERYLSSRGDMMRSSGGAAAQAPGPNFYAIVCGISQYEGPALQLRYAAKDAVDFAHALTLAAKGLFGADRVEVTLLSTDPGDPGAAPLAPTRANLEKAFGDLAVSGKVRSTDVLVIFLAGHGVSSGGPDDPGGGFYYLTREALGADLSDPEARRSQTLANSELTDWIRKIPALKQVMILDTCHAGSLVGSLSSTRDVPANQTRAIERLKDRTGLFVLAGAAADAVSYETSLYGQGLLTYSLLFGMLEEDLAKSLDVGVWFERAADKVPGLAQGIGGIQRPVVFNPAPLGLDAAAAAGAQGKCGGSFPVGRLDADAQKSITLKQPLPVIVRANLQEEVGYVDVEAIENALNDALCAASDAAVPDLLFVDADSFPGAYRLIGRYRIDGAGLVVNGGIFCDGRLVRMLDPVTAADAARAAPLLVKALKAAVDQSATTSTK